MKMPQLNRQYPSGAAKRTIKEERIKADEKCKRLLDRIVVVSGGTGEPTHESAASSNQVVNSSYICVVHKQMCNTQKHKFWKNEVDECMV